MTDDKPLHCGRWCPLGGCPWCPYKGGAEPPETRVPQPDPRD